MREGAPPGPLPPWGITPPRGWWELLQTDELNQQPISRGDGWSAATVAEQWCVGKPETQGQPTLDPMVRAPSASSDPRGNCHRPARHHPTRRRLDQRDRAPSLVQAPLLAVVGAQAAVAKGPREDACGHQPRAAPFDWKTPTWPTQMGAMAAVGCPSARKVRAVPASRRRRPTTNRCGHPPSDPPHPIERLHQNDRHRDVQGEPQTRHQQAGGPCPAIDPNVDRRDQDCAVSVVDVNP